MTKLSGAQLGLNLDKSTSGMECSMSRSLVKPLARGAGAPALPDEVLPCLDALGCRPVSLTGGAGGLQHRRQGLLHQRVWHQNSLRLSGRMFAKKLEFLELSWGKSFQGHQTWQNCQPEIWFFYQIWVVRNPK
jgi:hypothetical protein